MGEAMRRYWHPIAISSTLTSDRPHRTRLLGEDLIVFRDGNGRAGVVFERCAHRGTSLYFGRIEDDGIRCCYHGMKFDTQGHCLEQACEPERGRRRDAIRQPWYPVEERYGLVFVYMGPPERKPALPRYDFFEPLEEGDRLRDRAADPRCRGRRRGLGLELVAELRERGRPGACDVAALRAQRPAVRGHRHDRVPGGLLRSLHVLGQDQVQQDRARGEVSRLVRGHPLGRHVRWHRLGGRGAATEPHRPSRLRARRSQPAPRLHHLARPRRRHDPSVLHRDARAGGDRLRALDAAARRRLARRAHELRADPGRAAAHPGRLRDARLARPGDAAQRGEPRELRSRRRDAAQHAPPDGRRRRGGQGPAERVVRSRTSSAAPSRASTRCTTKKPRAPTPVAGA